MTAWLLERQSGLCRSMIVAHGAELRRPDGQLSVDFDRKHVCMAMIDSFFPINKSTKQNKSKEDLTKEAHRH